MARNAVQAERLPPARTNPTIRPNPPMSEPQGVRPSGVGARHPRRRSARAIALTPLNSSLGFKTILVSALRVGARAVLRARRAQL